MDRQSFEEIPVEEEHAPAAVHHLKSNNSKGMVSENIQESSNQLNSLKNQQVMNSDPNQQFSDEEDNLNVDDQDAEAPHEDDEGELMEDDEGEHMEDDGEDEEDGEEGEMEDDQGFDQNQQDDDEDQIMPNSRPPIVPEDGTYITALNEAGVDPSRIQQLQQSKSIYWKT